MRRSSPYPVSYSFGPGPLSTALKALIGANVVVFLLQQVLFRQTIGIWFDAHFGLLPMAVVERLYVWQPVTYMFLHAGLFHILFNMLALWMFGLELERMWGTREFLKFYFVTGIGAALLTVLVAYLGGAAAGIYRRLFGSACGMAVGGANARQSGMLQSETSDERVVSVVHPAGQAVATYLRHFAPPLFMSTGLAGVTRVTTTMTTHAATTAVIAP